ncbi:MAG: molybdopterin-synthase adenylyltransferase MoeB [Gammaproteobacteria bacterium]|nr:MAG: molybdopterin-synthase adenylyltransferase MoeB [Gammaproteobacteria bacterium]
MAEPRTWRSWLRGLQREIPQISPKLAAKRQRQDAILIDVREPHEWRKGSPVGALRISRGQLESRLDKLITDPDVEILLLCENGVRSLFAADSLKKIGYERVYPVWGGYRFWKECGLASETGCLSPVETERYSDQIRLPPIGQAGQLRLKNARVLCVGMGGLGSPAAIYLAAAGVGHLILIDADRVDRSNLQRQIIHAETTLGLEKVDSARQFLLRLNPDIQVTSIHDPLDDTNAEALIDDCDVVLDGCDNYETRYLVSDCCRKLARPHVYGAVQEMWGQVSVFWPSQQQGGCYRCLYPESLQGDAANCNTLGVLGVVPGVIGTLQATETLKILLGLGQPLTNRLLQYDAMTGAFRVSRIQADPECVCSSRK